MRKSRRSKALVMVPPGDTALINPDARRSETLPPRQARRSRYKTLPAAQMGVYAKPLHIARCDAGASAVQTLELDSRFRGNDDAGDGCPEFRHSRESGNPLRELPEISNLGTGFQPFGKPKPSSWGNHRHIERDPIANGTSAKSVGSKLQRLLQNRVNLLVFSNIPGSSSNLLCFHTYSGLADRLSAALLCFQ